MSKNEQSVEVPAEIELTPDHRKKIQHLFSEHPDRFLDARDFVGRAIDIFLTWERTPEKATAKMSEMDPTMEQFVLMSQMMQPKELEKIYPGYPEKFGNKWKEFIKSSPPGMATKTNESKRQREARQSERDFEEMQENTLKSCEFIKQVGGFDRATRTDSPSTATTATSTSATRGRTDTRR